MRFPHCYLWFAIIAIGLVPPALRADGPGTAAVPPLSWELTPYRIQLCVLVQPAARLAAIREAELAEQVAARAQAVYGGPWQVTVNQKFAAARNRWQRELPLADPPAALEAEANCDKVIFVAIREQAGQFQLTAREWDVTTRLWNAPIMSAVPQTGLLVEEAAEIMQGALGPLIRIDEVTDKATGILARARGGAIPKRDGSPWIIPQGTVLRPVLMQTDKQGQPQPATSTVIPATYLTVLAPASSTGSNQGVIKCGSAFALSGDIFPAYHPAQLRLAVAVAPSTLPVRVRVVDADASEQPLAGYEVQRAAVDAQQNRKLAAVGVTNQQGVVERVEIAPSLSWLYVMRGGAPLGGLPVVPGLQSEVVIAVKNDRRRLELAAEIAELNDDLLDTMARLAILGQRLREAVLKRDIALTGQLSQELRAAAVNPRLAARLAEFEKQMASTDEGTQARLAADLQKAKNGIEQLKEAQTKLP